jgi:hypothetical protein
MMNVAMIHSKASIGRVESMLRHQREGAHNDLVLVMAMSCWFGQPRYANYECDRLKAH